MDGIIRIWDSGSINKYDPILQLETNKVPVYFVLFSEDQNQIVGGYEDGVIKVWEMCAFNIPREFKAHDLRVRIIAWNKQHDLLLTGSDDACAKVWDLPTSRCIGIITSNSSRIHAGGMTLDGSIVAIGSDDNEISLWQVKRQ